MPRPRRVPRKLPPSAKRHPEPSPPPTELCPIAGIGASAGGMEAFSELLQHLPDDTGIAYVIVQHLDPKHGSLLKELLGRVTAMPVIQVADGLHVKPNHVHVITPNVEITISGNELHTEPRGVHSMPVDRFFCSLASSHGSRAIGIVLSGTASDGTEGLKAIKTAGGITFAQDEKSAKYHGMPRSAILAGCVDFVMPPGSIARELVRLFSRPYALPVSTSVAEPEGSQQFDPIFALLRNTTGVDFAFYKHATISRRIQRRMTLQKMDQVEQYAEYLRRNREELNALFQDLLIKVTSFFREPKAFEMIREQVLPQLLKDRPPQEPLRAWVPGCATGEEAYSLAICLVEYLQENEINLGVQVFGTDLSDSSLERARAGIYPESIAADVTPERLRRFFVPTNGSYRISRAIRDMCVFARQNLVKDPPFSRLDIITCRNLLIYLGSALQTKVLRYFHYALKPAGYLVLGQSETVGAAADLFVPVGKERIYTRRTPSTTTAMDFDSLEELRQQPEVSHADDWSSGLDLQKRVDQLILGKHSPAAVIVDQDLRVLQFRGHTAPYLEHTSGAPSLSLMKMTRGGVGLEIRKLVQTAKKTGTPAASEPLVAYGGNTRQIRVSVTPLEGTGDAEQVFLVLFESDGSSRSAPATAKTRKERGSQVAQLEDELAATKQYLQNVIEEQEAATEELKSAHEEVQSSNEELQSTNEELLTSKEELQSANEELSTINDEVQSRNAELTVINNDLNNLLSSVNIPILILGGDLRIRRCTPLAEKALNLRGTDVGRKITDFSLKIDVPDLEALVMEVIDQFHTKEREVHDDEGATYLMSVRPYRTVDNRIDGAVITLYDITDRKQAEVRRRGQFEEANIEAVGRLAGGIAHELNDLLTTIVGYAELLKARAENDQALQRDLEEVRNAGDRAINLARQLLAFGHKGVTQPALLDINALLAQIRQVLLVLTTDRVELSIVPRTESAPVIADRGQLEQVIVSLVINARDAMPDGGKITIETAAPPR